MKVAIIGAGNMGGAIARGFAKGSFVRAEDIICTARTQVTLDKLKADIPAINTSLDNLMACRNADVIILAVKPWLVEDVLRSIKGVIEYKKQIIVSVIAGISFEQLSKSFEQEEIPVLFRVIPNTAIAVCESMTIVSACGANKEQTDMILNVFDELGQAILVEERLVSAGTALASCGIAFAMRYIRAAMEGGIELGLYPKDARDIVLQTVKGAAGLLQANGNHPEVEIDKVTTPGGITIKGLNEMEHAGFTSSVIRGLKASK
jgi:pyrroline-5-carboxylate reductase